MITRETLPIQRTTLSRLREGDVRYYVEMESQYGSTYPYVCHGCGNRLTTGQRVCRLLNVRSTSGIDPFWCESCTRQFPRSSDY